MNNYDMMDDMSDQAQKHADYLVAARRLAAWDEVPVGVQDEWDFEAYCIADARESVRRFKEQFPNGVTFDEIELL